MTMIAQPHQKTVGRRICLIGTILAVATLAAAVEPARLGTPRYLRDGAIDKVCFDYQGVLHYREYQFPSAKYGYIDFEPASLKNSRFRIRPAANVLEEVRTVSSLFGHKERVRLRYNLSTWRAPTFHDTGKTFEIRFTPAAGGAPPVEPAIPPLEPLTAETAPIETASAADEPAASPSSGGAADDVFADYLKLSTEQATDADAAEATVPPAPPVPMTPVGLAFQTTAGGAADADRPAEPMARALGGEGSPPATVTIPESLADQNVEIVSGAKAFLPEDVEADQSKITSGSGFEFVDLSEEVFQKPVSLTFKDADLQNAVRILARHAGLNVVMDPSVLKGRLTVELDNVPVGAAMASILRTNNLEMIREEGSIYRVVPSSRVRRTPQREEVTVHIPLNWVSAQAVRGIIQPITDGDITADTLGNSLIVNDTPIKVNEIVNIVRKIDKPEKQVMLEARLVEMDVSMARQLAIQWQMYRGDNDGAPVADLFNGIQRGPAPPPVLDYSRLANQFITPNLGTGGGTAGLDSFTVTGGTGIWTFGTEASIFGQDFQLDTLLTAAEQAGLAKILVNPRIATLNNQPAKITVQQQIPWQSTVVGLGGVTQPTWNYEPVGVDMSITPSITNNDYVRMRITIKQDINRGQASIQVRPRVDTRQSQTNIIVRDEDTAAIMGLREQDFANNENGVPWLRNIPVLGWLFKDKTYNNEKTDLLAFITPHILKEEMVLTDQEKFRYNEIDLQWDLPDRFYDDVKIDLSQ